MSRKQNDIQLLDNASLRLSKLKERVNIKEVVEKCVSGEWSCRNISLDFSTHLWMTKAQTHRREESKWRTETIGTRILAKRKSVRLVVS